MTRSNLHLTLATLLVTGSLASGCVITISDDVSEDVGDTTEADGDSSSSSDDADSDSSSSSSSDDADSDSSSSSSDDADSDSSSSSDDADSDSSSSDDADSDTTTAGGECDPMDAMNGPEECFNPRGWFWNGAACEQIICTCDGSDCGSLFPSKEDCAAAYEPCTGPDCTPQEAEGIGPCDFSYGYAWTGLTCKDVSGCECVGADCDSLYPNIDACWDDHALCELPEPNCEPEDAKGEGPCDLFLGWAWDGNQCTSISGCECVGADCGSLPLELWECELEHASCDEPPPPLCEPMQAEGVGLCALFLGYKWTGVGCEGLSGCSCEGADCGKLFQELEQCQAACF